MTPDYYRATDNVSGFAAMTLEKRLPEIIRKALIEPQRTTEERLGMEEELKILAEGMRVTPIPIYPEEEPYWADFFRENDGLPLAKVPFFAAEAYFYRRLLNRISGGASASGDRLFFQQKVRSLEKGIHAMAHITRIVTGTDGVVSADLSTLLMIALNGNAVDLSQLNVNAIRELPEDHLLVDDRPNISGWLAKCGNGLQVAIFADNSGPELHADLLLALGLLSCDRIAQVCLHLKQYPTFVSDATQLDVVEHIDRLAASEHEALRSFARAVRHALGTGSLTLHHHPFWNSPLHFTHLPSDLSGELAAMDLVISKGDANYRRFFEDRRWPVDMAPSTLLAQFPTSVIHLRMLKCELALGLEKMRATRLDHQDPSWRTNGTYGIITFHSRAKLWP